MLDLLIIADDLTGALDTGVQLSQCGIKTLVTWKTDQTAFFAADQERAGALVIDTASRHLHAQEAYQAVYKVASLAETYGVTYIYKKTDSALRGNVSAELMAAAAATGIKPIPFLPAWPENGRTTREGCHFVHGIPLAESEFAADPLEPITTSEISQILCSGMKCRSVCIPVGTEQWPDDPDIAVFEAETGEQVDAVGELLHRHGMLHLSAGCARFIQSLIPHYTFQPPAGGDERSAVRGGVLLACGSLNSASLRETIYAMDRLGFQPVQPDGDPCGTAETVLPAEEGPLILRSSRSTTKEEVQRELAAIPFDRRIQHTWHVAGCMSQRIQEILDHREIGTLIVFGGDTLFAAIRQLEIDRLEPVRELDTGVVLCRTLYRGRSLNLVSKAGSFGKDNLIESIMRQLPQEN